MSFIRTRLDEKHRKNLWNAARTPPKARRIPRRRGSSPSPVAMRSRLAGYRTRRSTRYCAARTMPHLSKQISHMATIMRYPYIKIFIWKKKSMKSYLAIKEKNVELTFRSPEIHQCPTRVRNRNTKLSERSGRWCALFMLEDMIGWPFFGRGAATS